MNAYSTNINTISVARYSLLSAK